MNYYILKDNDVIKEGDFWHLDANGNDTWERCSTSVGQRNIAYRESIEAPSWQVRRPIKKTKLGNIL